MQPYDYIFYRTYCVYKYRWKENIPDIYANGIITITQLANIVSILFFLETLLDISLIVSNLVWGIFMVILIALNYVLYEYFKPFKQLELKWGTEPRIVRQTKGYLVILYIILSFAVFILEIQYSYLITDLGHYLGFIK